MIRWLAKNQFANGDARARLSINRTQCDVREAVEIEALCLGDDGYPLENDNVRLQIEHADGRRQIVAMQPAVGGWGVYRARFHPDREGTYTIRPIVAAHGEEPLPSTVELEVVRVDLEKHALAQNQGALMAIAEASGGKYLTLSEARQLSELMTSQIEKRMLITEISPCRTAWYYAILAAALAGAWLMRKLSGLA